MAHALVEGYIAERDQLLNTINVFKNTAASQNRDPGDNELEAMSTAFKRIDKLDELINIVGQEREMDADTRDKLMRSTPQMPDDGGLKYRSAGELMWDCIHANYGTQQNHDDQEAKQRWDGVMKRAAQHMGTKAADTVATAGDIGGLYVAPIVGPVIDIFPKGQPLLTAIGKRPSPSAMSFVRPRIVDADFKDGAATQSAEKAELTSKKFDVKVDTLTLDTVGGYLNVSQQLMSLQAGAWDIIVSQLQKRVAWQGEAAACAQIDLTTKLITLAAGATAAVTLKALFDGAAAVYDATQELPTWIAYGPKGWAMLGSLADTAGRPLFPFLGAANSLGTAGLGDFNLGPLGLRQIVTPGIDDTVLYMGNDLALEAYGYSFPVLEAVEPSMLGRQVAVAEALAFFRPTTTEAVTGGSPAPAKQEGCVKIGPSGS